MRRHRDVAAMVRSSTSSERTTRLCNFTISGQCVVCTIAIGFFILLIGTFLAIFSTEGQHSYRLRHTMRMVKIISYSLIGVGSGIAIFACGFYALALNFGREDEENTSEYQDTQRIINRSVGEDIEAATTVQNTRENYNPAAGRHVSWYDVVNNEN